MHWIRVSYERQEGDDEVCDEQGKELLRTAKNVTVGITVTLLGPS